jgi:hypothetical protein
VRLGDLAFSSLVAPLRIHAGLEHGIEGTRALLRRRVARDHGVLGAPARAAGGECPGGPLLDPKRAMSMLIPLAQVQR